MRILLKTIFRFLIAIAYLCIMTIFLSLFEWCLLLLLSLW